MWTVSVPNEQSSPNPSLGPWVLASPRPTFRRHRRNRTRASPLSHRRSIRHRRHALPLHDHAIGLRLAVDVEIEGGTLVGIAEIEIAAGERDLVALGRAARDDLAR